MNSIDRFKVIKFKSGGYGVIDLDGPYVDRNRFLKIRWFRSGTVVNWELKPNSKKGISTRFELLAKLNRRFIERLHRRPIEIDLSYDIV